MDADTRKSIVSTVENGGCSANKHTYTHALWRSEVTVAAPGCYADPRCHLPAEVVSPDSAHPGNASSVLPSRWFWNPNFPLPPPPTPHLYNHCFDSGHLPPVSRLFVQPACGTLRNLDAAWLSLLSPLCILFPWVIWKCYTSKFPMSPSCLWASALVPSALFTSTRFLTFPWITQASS